MSKKNPGAVKAPRDYLGFKSLERNPLTHGYLCPCNINTRCSCLANSWARRRKERAPERNTCCKPERETRLRCLLRLEQRRTTTVQTKNFDELQVPGPKQLPALEQRELVPVPLVHQMEQPQERCSTARCSGCCRTTCSWCWLTAARMTARFGR